jgi:hypothetical protein
MKCMALELKTNSLRLMMLLVLHAITSLKLLQVAEADRMVLSCCRAGVASC